MTANPSPSLLGALKEARQDPEAESLPRDSDAATIAAWIQRRIAEELRVPVDRVDVNAPIKTLGVPSIAGLTITGDLAEALDHTISESFLWTHATILAAAQSLEAELRADPARDMQDPRLRAIALEAGLTEEQYDALFNDSRTQPSPRACPGSLLKVARRGDDRFLPVVWMGQAGVADALAGQLPGNVYHALPGWSRIPYRQEVARGIARLAVEELRAAGVTRQAVVVAGFCWGARLALEVTAALEQAGHRVAHLVIIEYPGPSRNYRRMRRLFEIVDRPQPVRKGLEAIGRRVARLASRTAGMANAGAGDGGNRDATAAMRRMQGNTRPLPYPSFSAPVTLVFGKQSYLSLTPDKTCGWSRHLPRTTRLVLLEGAHMDLTRGEALERVVRLVRRRTTPQGRQARSPSFARASTSPCVERPGVPTLRG